jgi:hypothetical protein
MEAFKASFAFIDNNVLVAKSLNEFIYVSSHAPIYEGSFEKLMLYALWYNFCMSSSHSGLVKGTVWFKI